MTDMTEERKILEADLSVASFKQNILRPMTTEEVQEWLKKNAKCSVEELKKKLPHMTFDEEGPTGEKHRPRGGSKRRDRIIRPKKRGDSPARMLV